MKAGHCRKCNKYQRCTVIKDCPLVKAEMKRIERGRHKHNIDIIYQADMDEGLLRLFDKLIYGDTEA